MPSHLSRLVKPGLLVTGFCFLLPDLTDKPLWVLGVISDGRYIGHTLLMVFLVATGFGIARRPYALFAICGSMPHLLFDTGPHSSNPWFYPFKRYHFPSNDFHRYVTLPNIIETLMEMLVVLCALLLVWAVFRGLVFLFRRRHMTASEDRKDVSGASEATSKRDWAPVHGSIPCWVARFAGTLLSLFAVTYVLYAEAKYDSSWSIIAAAICVFALSMIPSVVAWWSHRIGGVFVLVVCIAYTELASRTIGGSGFVHFFLPFSALWGAIGLLHIVLSFKERTKEISAI